MRIVALEADNFKRLKAVEIVPKGCVVEIVGRNGQGKSSVLDSIWAALGGSEASPNVPIRRGEMRASVRLNLGDIIVERTWDAKGSKLKVTGGTGSPQSILDGLVSRVAFDPLTFVREKPKVQAEILRKLAGLDFTDLDKQEAVAFAARTDVNREVKRLEALAGPPRDFAGVPDAEIGVDELAAQYRKAAEVKAENDRVRAAHTTADNKYRQSRADEAKAEELIAAAEANLRVAKATKESATKAVASCQDLLYKAGEAASSLVDPDLDAIAVAGKAAKATNEQVRAKIADAALRRQLTTEKAKAEALTKEITTAQADRQARLAAAKFPVPGISLDGDIVLLDSIPTDQASTSQQIRLGLSVGMALNPALRVSRIPNGSLLDEEGMQTLYDWAVENDTQVFIERVGGPNSPTGIVIEDGEVLADRQPALAV